MVLNANHFISAQGGRIEENIGTCFQGELPSSTSSNKKFLYDLFIACLTFQESAESFLMLVKLLIAFLWAEAF